MTNPTPKNSPTTPEMIALDRRDLTLLLRAALPALREQIEEAEIKVIRHERFHELFPAFAGDLDPRSKKLREAEQHLDELRLAYAAALAAQDQLDWFECEQGGEDVAAFLRKQYGARPFHTVKQNGGFK